MKLTQNITVLERYSCARLENATVTESLVVRILACFYGQDADQINTFVSAPFLLLNLLNADREYL